MGHLVCLYSVSVNVLGPGIQKPGPSKISALITLESLVKVVPLVFQSEADPACSLEIRLEDSRNTSAHGLSDAGTGAGRDALELPLCIAEGCSSSAVRKKVSALTSCSDWLLSCSVVDAISSEAEAFCWMTFSSCINALLICSAPISCSLLAAAISCTSSAVFWMSGTSLFSISPARSDTFTVVPESYYFGSSLLATLCKLAHLGSNHGEPFAVFPGSGRFNRSIECQKISLAGDLLND